MARNRFGGDLQSFIVDLVGRYWAKPGSAPTLTFWNGPPETVGRVQHTDLRTLDAPAVPVSTITAAAVGTWQEFEGPDDSDLTRMWASPDGGATGAWITTSTPPSATNAQTATFVTEAGPTQDALSAAIAAGNAGIEGRVTTLEANTPTLEEQAHSVVLGSIATTTTQAVHVAAFPCHVEQISLVAGTAVAESDADYWTVALFRYRAGAPALIASKTTQTVATGGEGIAALTDWNFDLTVLANTGLAKGDVLAVTFTPTGTPASLDSLAVTFRAPAGEVVVVPEPTVVASDSFDRADDTASLGTADSGQTWTSILSSWEIAGNQAKPDLAGGRKAATIDAGIADCTVQAKYGAVGTVNDGLVLRATDGNNFLFATTGVLQKRVAGAQSVVGNYSSTAVAGDTIRAVLSGDTITIYLDAGSTGTFTEVYTTTEAFNQTATQHGLYSTDTAGVCRMDDFKVTA